MRKSVLIAFSLFLFSNLVTTNLFAQKVYTICDVEPTYSGGYISLMNFLSENIKYPEIAKANGVQGETLLSFIIEKDGTISNIEVLKSLSKECDEEAVRVLKLMPKWESGKRKNKSIRFKMNMPISFSLTNDKGQDSIYSECEESPEFKGGDDSLNNFLGRNIKYPRIAKENGDQGKVIAAFVIEKDGSISNIKIIKSVSKECDEEVIRLIKLLPKWKPAKQNGEFVRSQYFLPITFNLQ